MAERTVASTSSRALLAACERLSIARAGLLSSAGLRAEEVDDLDARLPVSQVSRLWQAALEQSGDPGLGLRTAIAVPFGAYRVVDFLAASSPTVGDGLARVARYFPLINESLSWEIEESAESFRMRLASSVGTGTLPRPYAEYTVAVTILHCRHASGFEWPLESVAFSFAAPPSSELHATTFGCPVRFGAPHNEFSITRATRDLPTKAPSPELLQTLEAHASKLLEKLKQEGLASAQVARVILEELESGGATLSRVARRLSMSTRTLQRRLDEEQTSFADLLDRTRRHLADVYLRERGLALNEVAYLLGFSEQSAFTRAFSRWYGIAPRQYRNSSPG